MNVLKVPKTPSFQKVGIAGRIFESKHLTPSAEFFTVDTDTGHATTIRQRECDFFYHVLAGAGQFIVEEQKQPCSQGDLVVIPRGTWFRYEGKMKLLAASVPPWREEQEDTRKD
jgi:mannose-6-phosphate isomerase-like protein (cupin superfamily)